MLRQNVTTKMASNLPFRFLGLRTPHHTGISVLGIVLLFVFIVQILSGVMIALSLVSDPLTIPMSRNEEDMEDMYTDDFFWSHERGVDLIFILIYLHIFRKIQIGTFNSKQEGAWKTGSFLFLFLHAVTFFGLVLCCTHLSEVTLTIAANIAHSLLLKKTKIYWWIFPNQEMNIDTTLRLMYLHYITAFVLVLCALYHSLEMHNDWKDSEFDESQRTTLSWADDVLKNELLTFSSFLLYCNVVCFYLYNLSEPSSTELFMWGDVGAVSEIRFFGVTPHWYFRAYMSWLVVCPHHYLGLGGLVFFMVIVYYQPVLKRLPTPASGFLIWSKSNITAFLFITFVLSIAYGASYLAYGKFYNRLGGNPATLFSFSYVLVFLSIPLSYLFRKTNKELVSGTEDCLPQ